MAKALLCQRNPIFYFLSVWEKRIKRYIKWQISTKKYCSLKNETSTLPYRVKSHQSLLIRKLGNSDIELQYNKINNLQIAVKRINGIIIKPGEEFSFWKLVGLPSKSKGYIEGMVLSRGEVKRAVGGGLCQLANLLNWMIIHSPLTITERHHHSFDPFPDNGRELPFGSGATVFYNYLDYQFKNNTPHAFQLNIWLTDQHLKGELRSDSELLFSYHVYEQNHAFLVIDDKYYRKNEIWRDTIDKGTGTVKNKELIISNFAEVKYKPINQESINT